METKTNKKSNKYTCNFIPLVKYVLLKQMCIGYVHHVYYFYISLNFV